MLRRILPTCLAAALALLAWLPSANAQMTPRETSSISDQFGVSIPGVRLMFESPQELALDLDRVAASGARWLRFDVPWNAMEWVKGETHYDRVDVVVEQARKRGLRLLGILHTLPATERPAGTSWNYGPVSAQERAAFARFSAQAAARYAGRIDHWEVWNEPNLDQFWSPRPSASDYGLLLQSVYPAIKNAAPQATVITGGTGGGDRGPDVPAVTWYEQLYATNAHRYFDAVGHHPYPTPAMATQAQLNWTEVTAIRQLMDSHGDPTKAIWGTETGSATGGDYSVNEQQSGQLVRLISQAWRSVSHHGVLFYYTLMDTDEPGTEGRFGLYRQDGTPKPSYGVLQELAGVPQVRPSAVSLRNEGGVRRVSATLEASAPVAVDSVKALIRDSRGTSYTMSLSGARTIHGPVAVEATGTLLPDGFYTYQLVYSQGTKDILMGSLQTLQVSPQPAAVNVASVRLQQETGEAKASMTLNTNGVLPTQMLILAVRDAQGRNYDIWVSGGSVLSGQQTFAGSRSSLPAGQYTYRVAYLSAAGEWTEIGERGQYSTSPTPPPTPTPTPTPTGTLKDSSLSLTGTSFRVRGAATTSVTGQIKVKAIIAAIRDSAERNRDIHLASNVTLTGSQFWRISSPALPRGDYTYWLAYQTEDGVWHRPDGETRYSLRVR